MRCYAWVRIIRLYVTARLYEMFAYIKAHAYKMYAHVWDRCITVKLPDGIGIVQPFTLAVGGTPVAVVAV